MVLSNQVDKHTPYSKEEKKVFISNRAKMLLARLGYKLEGNLILPDGHENVVVDYKAAMAIIRANVKEQHPDASEKNVYVKVAHQHDDGRNGLERIVYGPIFNEKLHEERVHDFGAKLKLENYQSPFGKYVNVGYDLKANRQFNIPVVLPLEARCDVPDNEPAIETPKETPEKIPARLYASPCGARDPILMSEPETTWEGNTSEEDLKAILRLVDLPDSRAIAKKEVDLVEVAVVLYDCKPEEIKSIRQDRKFKYYDYDHYSHFKVRFTDGAKSDFYAKPGWQRPLIEEALGNVLANLLIKGGPISSYKFAACEETGTFVSVGIKGRTFHKVKPEDFSDTAAFNYGLAAEIYNVLGLHDRSNSNSLIDDADVITPIDFASVFANSLDSGYTPDHSVPDNAEMVDAGREMAREMIVNNFKKNKGLIEDLISYSIHRGAVFEFAPKESIDSYVSSYRNSSKEIEVAQNPEMIYKQIHGIAV